MTDKQRDEKLDRLLHDAERAEGGVLMARLVADEAGAVALTRKAKRLRAQAEKLDPEHKSYVWTL